MELVYLWVKDYKNIHKQGFNFSGRYRCNYDPDKNELTIKKNKEYVHIFPENINLTAIVGKNGSGKSSILTGLTNHKIIVEKDGELYSNDFDSSEVYIKKPLNRTEDYEIIYIDFDLIKINPTNDYGDYYALNIYDKNLYSKVENGLASGKTFDIENFRNNFFKVIIGQEKAFKTDMFFFNPIHISFSFYIAPLDRIVGNYESINRLITFVNDPNCQEHRTRLLTFLLKKAILDSEDSVLTFLQISNAKDALSIENEIMTHSNIDNKDELYRFIDALASYDVKHLDIGKEFKTLYNEHQNAFLQLLSIGYLKFDLADEIGREYFDLSQGERKLFTEFLMLFDAINKTKKSNVFLVLDEPDLTLHPDWQKSYIKELIQLISNFDKKYHVIITSHSPFVLSDIPKENVIFLEDGKQVYPNINTFGANIHTLLSHGFFLENGLMGEFAKEKINTAITYLNQKQLSKDELSYCEDIISIIGEPILKKQLQKMLDSKRLSKVDKIDVIEKQIKALQEELKKVKK